MYLSCVNLGHITIRDWRSFMKLHYLIGKESCTKACQISLCGAGWGKTRPCTVFWFWFSLPYFVVYAIPDVKICDAAVSESVTSLMTE